MTAWSSSAGAEVSTDHSALINAVRVLRERWWLVVIAGIVCLAVMLGLSAHAQKQYTATATLLVKPSNLPSVISPNEAQPTDPTTLERIQSDDASLLTSGTIATAAKQMLNSPESVGHLLGQVKASANSSDDAITVSVTDPNPVQAARKANAFASSLVSYLTASAQQQLISGQARIQSELSHLPGNDPSRSALQQGLEQVIALEAVTNGGVQIVEQATAPTSPSSPKVKRNAAIGLLAGILIGLGLAFLLDVFDRRIKSSETIEQLYGLPAMTTVPLLRKPPGEREPRIDLEPFRILRDALGFISLREHPRVILVTSAVSSEGKTSVSVGLCRAMSVAGKSVAVIEGDVHRPALTRQLGISSKGRGLMNALAGGGSGALALVQPVPSLPSLSVLPSGPFTPNSAELLRLPAMNQVLEDLADAVDFVVIDGPPLLPVADAQVLLQNPVIDVVLVVARPYLTTREHIRSAVPVLKRNPDKGFGLVLNAVRERTGGYYQYGGPRENDEILEQNFLAATENAERPRDGARSTSVRRVPRSPTRSETIDPLDETS